MNEHSETNEHGWFRRNAGWLFGIGLFFITCSMCVVVLALFYFRGPIMLKDAQGFVASAAALPEEITKAVTEPAPDQGLSQADVEALWAERLAELSNDAGANETTSGENVSGSSQADWPIEDSSQQFSMPAVKSTWSQGSWEVIEYDLDDDPIVKGWLERLQDPKPSVWRTFPNIPNPDVPEFNVAAGAEYGVANVPYCQQDMRCDLVVPPWHYRLVTGNYKFLDRTCGDEEVGCLLLVINVMDKTYTWRDVIVDNGFTVPGRYWDGDKLEWATWGLVSHASANMLNMPTMASEDKVLNAGDPGNAGGNCGDVNGCETIDATVVVHAGDRVLAIAHTTVTR